MKLPIAFVFFQWEIKTAYFAGRERMKDPKHLLVHTNQDKQFF